MELDLTLSLSEPKRRNFIGRGFFVSLLRFSWRYVFSTALNIANMRQDWWVHILYLTNFKVAIDQQWGDAGHFWSLAVEEQFYLFWFVAVVMLPKRWLLPMIVNGLLLPTASRAIAATAGVNEIVPAVLIVGSTDCLCIGALMAYGQIERPDLGNVIRRALINPLVIMAACAVFVTGELVADQLYFAKSSASVVLAASLVSIGIAESKGTLFNWLEWRPVRHIGKISYGIYVYHQFLPTVMIRLKLIHISASPKATDWGAQLCV